MPSVRGGGDAGAEHARRRRRPRLGQATTSPGMSRSTPTALSLWKWPPNPFWYASPATRTTIGLRNRPWEKKRQRGRLAAQLVLGVVQVGQVLDLRDRQQTGQPGAEAETEDRLLVEEGVEDPGRAEPAGQAAGHAVDPALDADVLAEHDHPAVGVEQLGQRGVDRLGEGARADRDRRRPQSAAPPSRATCSGCRGRERRHHLGAGPQQPAAAPARRPRSSTSSPDLRRSGRAGLVAGRAARHAGPGPCPDGIPG